MNINIKQIIQPLVIIGLVVASVYLLNQNKKLDTQLGIVNSNYLELNTNYELANGYNRVLELKVNDLQIMNDDLIHSLDSVSKALKINQEKLQYALAMQSELIDTVIVEIPITDSTAVIQDSTHCDFGPIVMDFNELTRSTISLHAGKLTNILEIRDRLYIFIEEDKVWRNPKRKGFFDRLIHWDWKKDKIYKGKVDNENKKIQITETRFIKAS